MTNWDTSLLNAFRKTIMSDFINSGFSMENITVIKNSTCFTEEVLQHRVSLIPVNSKMENLFELNQFNFNNCDMVVTSNMFRSNSKTHDFSYMMRNVMICNLKPNEELFISAKCTRATSNEKGISYRPVSTAYFSKLVSIYTLNEKISNIIREYLQERSIGYISSKSIDNNIAECLGHIPKIHKQNDKTYKLTLITADRSILRDIEELNEYLELNKEDIIVAQNEGKSIFTIKPFLLPAQEIIDVTKQILHCKFTSFLTTPRKYLFIESSNTHTLEVDTSTHSIQVVNAICHFIQQDKSVIFAHYSVEHHESSVCTIYIQTKNGQMDDIRTIVLNALSAKQFFN